jgi:hypothetical protein
MKPAEIYEKHPHMDAYRVGGFYSPYCLLATEKRFSGSELAAEYWLLSSRAERMLGYGDGKGSATEAEAKTARSRMATIQRFATQPNFDEAS